MKSTNKRLSAEERKKQILKCAVRVFARSNFRKARVADIAAEAGISEAMIYKLFPSKKAVFLEILEHMSKRILVFWQEELDKEPDIPKALRNMSLAYYRRMTRHPEDLKVHFQAVSEIDDRDIARRLRSDHRNYMRFIRKVLKKGVDQGTLRADINPDAMMFLWDGVGILMNMMKLLDFDKELNEKLVAKLTDHLIDSVRA